MGHRPELRDLLVRIQSRRGFRARTPASDKVAKSSKTKMCQSHIKGHKVEVTLIWGGVPMDSPDPSLSTHHFFTCQSAQTAGHSKHVHFNA